MSNHHPDAIEQDRIALTASGARQLILIRVATPAEIRQYRERFPGAPFNYLPCTITITGFVDGAPLLRYNFWPFSLPIGCGRPELPSCPQVIAEIDAGKGVIVETVRGFELRSLGERTPEWLAAASAYLRSKRP